MYPELFTSCERYVYASASIAYDEEYGYVVKIKTTKEPHKDRDRYCAQ